MRANAACGLDGDRRDAVTLSLFLEQSLNGVQLGVMLFLVAAGLTLVFGIMNFINLAHGALYMLGAYFAVTAQTLTGSFLLALAFALPATALVGVAVEMTTLRRLYARSHLDQVLCSFGLIMFANAAVRFIFGPLPKRAALPPLLAGTVEIIPGAPYPAFRLAIILVGLAVAAFLFVLVTRTRLGMLIRAGASDRDMAAALGIDIKRLFTWVFALGAALAALAGAMAGPLLAVQVGMGDSILILTLVVIVIGGVGSIRGAVVAALLVGLIDTFGRVLLPPALADIGIYVLMAMVLAFRPRGLFPAHG
ncbi:amino acid/amide ABC transporter membrane protein 1, HAAT family [Rhizobiales bacterium GAS191]|jgi:branched-chain amino acid transport system permease protein|nr:amino acid/amide ABC transporter membrane protein 1, HAAT family [Rhizobiales bacterium GAS113]SED98852.1 amino acid/amide ABC transporter membrane protein 1, HAAT family [Rhizobiales bacterium GAS191]SEE49868.1 amino acid/amide ABC transporter membrane protein 1, HAAT family [Rhizobiales bacterium GAS188]